MVAIKAYTLGGLDQKSNDLIRATEKASDMLNLEYNTQTTIKKRNGYELDSVQACDDMVYYPSVDEKLFFTKNDNTVIIKGNGYSKSLDMPYQLGSTVSISNTENTLSTYFTNTDYSIPVTKYDGSNIYRAGLPTPRLANDTIPTMTNMTGGFTRIFYSFKDINGLTVFSPYYQFSGEMGGSSTVSVNTLKEDTTCEANGFLNRYCWINDSAGFDIIPSSSNTALATNLVGSRKMPVSRHNYQVGDKFLFDKECRMIQINNTVTAQYPAPKTFITLEVEAVNPSWIQFKQDLTSPYLIEVGGISALGSLWSINVAKTEYPLDCRTKLHVYTSSISSGSFNQFFTVILNGANIADSFTVANAFVFSPITYDQYAIPMEDIYDTASSKIMPPFCKYLTSYGNQIVYGSIESYIGFNNRKIQYNNNDLIIYSDILQGDCCENTSEFNRQIIGETYDGEITALQRCNDSVVVFKGNSTFTLDGVLSSGQYSIRKINTNGVGCRSHKSISPTDEGILFQAHNGIYFTNGINIQRLTYELDSFFGSDDYSTVRSARLKKKQKTLFYIPSKNKIVVIDYYYNQVYLWDNITPSNGFIEDKNGVVYFSDGVNVYVFSDTYHDTTPAGAERAINAIYSTTWHHAGEPALRKKYIDMRIFALTSDVFDLTIKTQIDWSDPDNAYSTPTIKTSKIKSFSSTDQTVQYVLDMITSRSMRVVFSNNVVNQNMVLTGYEINLELYNVRDKN